MTLFEAQQRVGEASGKERPAMFGWRTSTVLSAAAAEALPELGAELDATSVSGLSSGAYMAGQIELAHATHIVGVGIVAGGPYACAETQSARLFPYWPIVLWQNATQAANQCMATAWGPPDVSTLAKRAKDLADEGAIEPLEGLADDK